MYRAHACPWRKRPHTTNMRIELWNDVGPDGPEIWACVNGHRLARVKRTEDGAYHVVRDNVAPELEPAVCELEDGPGSAGPLAEGEIRGLDVRAPSLAEVKAAQRNPPPYRPEPKT